MDPKLRRSLYSMMLVAAAGVMVARVGSVELLYEPSVYAPKPSAKNPEIVKPQRTWPPTAPEPFPTFSSNDRVRWATVKALVEEGTFAIGRREPAANEKGYVDTGIAFPPVQGFGSVDKIMNPETKEYFSTKPPLLTMFAAGQYWIIHKGFQKNLSEHKWETVVPILLVTNVIPLLIALFCLSRLLEQYGKTDWGRLFTFAVACFGTFLPTFAVTLNNHVPAACCIMYALYALLAPTRPRSDGSEGPVPPWRIAVVGLFSGLALCMDFPAAAFAGLAALLILRDSWKGLLVFLPALAIAPAAQTWVNIEMIGTWKPAYALFGTEWYEYPGSHWLKRHDPTAEGIDFIDEPKDVYAFHLLVGHHGLFSLTPVWLLAVIGCALKLGGERRAEWYHRLVILIPVVVVAFYIVRTNNYGGWTSGPRWLFWMTPLLLLSLVPMADVLSRVWIGRAFAGLCLAASAFSATWPWANPWRHPWIYQWCEYMGWVRY